VLRTIEPGLFIDPIGRPLSPMSVAGGAVISAAVIAARHFLNIAELSHFCYAQNERDRVLLQTSYNVNMLSLLSKPPGLRRGKQGM